MPRKRQPLENWRETQRSIWEHDKGRYQGPTCKGEWPPPIVDKAALDPARSEKQSTSALIIRRMLYVNCRELRADHRYQALMVKMLIQGLLPRTGLIWFRINLTRRV